MRGLLEKRIEPPEWQPVGTGQLRPSTMRCIRFEKRAKVERGTE